MGGTKLFKRADVAANNHKESVQFIIDNKVYDVTKFLDDHPGGNEVLNHVAGNDATEDFVDMNHSVDAKEMMKKYEIGEIVEEEKIHTKKKLLTTYDKQKGSLLSSWKLPVVLGLLAMWLYQYLTS